MKTSDIGKLAGKLVTATKSTPSKTSSKFGQIKRDLADGYREVVPAKTKED